MSSRNHVVAPIMMEYGMPKPGNETPIVIFGSFIRADCSELNLTMEPAEFEPVCYSNIDNMCNEYMEKSSKFTNPGGQ